MSAAGGARPARRVAARLRAPDAQPSPACAIARRTHERGGRSQARRARRRAIARARRATIAGLCNFKEGA